ncbi:SDR family NAD(P)-dependent oxidoreductase [Rhodobacteraceae bacterium B1Z28]|uniref:SDR family NAD(P)-dependent oxidoreductase n=1 Tax=Ruegeria haliotis TaxID=2747601 RepID=A0ABX2PMA6_9RHOB|nr:SDR family NAD(P)-dependent oxidoreductase [Ruegeria haliotis]NVO55238.1 SDR family NAD(P)-dependent oxidoreductase [Ruegeria haliotis]
MELHGKTVVVTGAAQGIGKGMAMRYAHEGARVVCADIDDAKSKAVAEMIGGHAFGCDVSSEEAIRLLIENVESQIGPIDLFCANAGILTLGGLDVPDEEWDRIWKINVMSHVWTARHLVPRMLERGDGYILITASAAGLLNQPGAAPYGVTKHAAVGMAEWLSLTYGHKGLRVSVLCPQAVRSEMTRGHEDSVAAIDGMLEPEDVAQACVDAIRSEQFLVLPHPQVLDYMKLKTADYDRWLAGMRKLNQQFIEDS